MTTTETVIKTGDTVRHIRPLPSETERGELTLEQLRDWLSKRRVSMLAMESATSDHAQAKMYRTKAHELLTIINAIDRGELPS